jgi:hypothetical protein
VRAVDDEVLARRDVAAHEQVEDALGGLGVGDVTRRSVRAAGPSSYRRSWSASISPRPL